MAGSISMVVEKGEILKLYERARARDRGGWLGLVENGVVWREMQTAVRSREEEEGLNGSQRKAMRSGQRCHGCRHTVNLLTWDKDRDGCVGYEGSGTRDAHI